MSRLKKVIWTCHKTRRIFHIEIKKCQKNFIKFEFIEDIFITFFQIISTNIT